MTAPHRLHVRFHGLHMSRGGQVADQVAEFLRVVLTDANRELHFGAQKCLD